MKLIKKYILSAYISRRDKTVIENIKLILERAMTKFSLKVVMLLAVSFNVFANTQELEDSKRAIINSNVNISISYEQYVQAKNTTRAKTLSLLPSLSVDMLIYDYQYAILRSVIPEPQKYFQAKAQKDLQLAAAVNTRILEKNLVEDFEKTLYLNQYHSKLLTSFKEEEKILEDIAARSKEAYDLGAISFTEYYRAQRDVVNSQTQFFNTQEVVNNQKFALNLILSQKPSAEINFSELDFYNRNLPFPTSVETATDLALNNSLEVAQFDHLANAARDEKKGVQISWLSWSGVGFDYFARVSIAKSEIRKIGLQKEKSKQEIRSQVATQYSLIANQNKKIAFQAKLVDMAQNEYDQALDNEEEVLGTHIATQKAKLGLMYAQRDLMRMNYELEIQFIKLKRLLGVNMITNQFPLN